MYGGPKAGIEKRPILFGNAGTNVSVSGANWLIHTASGNDAIAALDGGTGLNFLTGGSGADTVFFDARGATAAIWSTVVGFGADDAATLWGVSDAGFTLAWAED